MFNFLKRKKTDPYEKERLRVLTNDGYIVYCEIETLMVSSQLRKSIEVAGRKDQEALTIPFCKDVVLRVLWWMENHLEDKDLTDYDPIPETMDAWERCFFNTTIDMIMKLIHAANYLQIRRLVVLGYNKLAQIMNENLSQENPVRAIRDTFHIRAPDVASGEKMPNESISQMFVFEGYIRTKDSHSNIDVLDVEVIHLPPRRLECPDQESLSTGGEDAEERLRV